MFFKDEYFKIKYHYMYSMINTKVSICCQYLRTGILSAEQIFCMMNAKHKVVIAVIRPKEPMVQNYHFFFDKSK
jgi:hypothetical protein